MNLLKQSGILVVAIASLSPVLAYGQGDQAFTYEVTKVIFQSDHGLLRDGPNNFASDGTGLFSPRGFDMRSPPLEPIANPISHTKNLQVVILLTHRALPAGSIFDNEGHSESWSLQFLGSGYASGDYRTDGLTSQLPPLPNYVTIRNYAMTWSAWPEPNQPPCGGPSSNLGNLMYITWSTPIDPNPTAKRMGWACAAANWDGHQGTQTEEDVADAIWNALAGNPPYEPGARPIKQGATWELLDGAYSGECDEQANLMKRGINILGILAQTHLIRASTDTNVVDLESANLPDANGKLRKAWLAMDFDLGLGFSWNAFEGCCETANEWYAVWPHIRANSALELYRALGFQQYWIFTVGDTEPTGTGWVFESLADPSPVPKA